MQASAQSVRIAPKKANLIARMVRGLSVPEAMEQLRRTNKKGARIVELVLRSAIANASHNDKQDAQTMVIKTIVVNQGQAYHRGMPMARGRQRPYRKFLSHIEITLGFAGDDGKTKKTAKKEKTRKKGETSSQPAQSTVQKTRSVSKSTKKTSSSESSVSSVSSAS